ncbi:flagellin [Teichococcus cervicalis]|uniref:Flagellin n=1 Tax=Pseudoroseomonas cervicalis ATCC 49957 TaxID=525371 RepID=D5RG51_9PROT|nr:flagellin [Pseudoroseomonas cervicalis]EFH13719.1 bacterial flagellin domain protein [Pseudoroseomonas cervicalis ATCC 49957]
MVSSILTNNGAMTALQSLKATQKNLLQTQNRISTGLKVSTAKDNAATWAVATSMRSDIANYKQVSENLSVSSSILSTAEAAATTIADLVKQVRTKVTAAQNPAVDKRQVQADIDALLAQINTTAEAASFKGVNLVNSSGTQRVLTSVNAIDGVSTAAYSTLDRQNLKVADGAMLESLKDLTVLSRADQTFANTNDGTKKLQLTVGATGTNLNNGNELDFKYVDSTGTQRTLKVKLTKDINDIQTLVDYLNADSGFSKLFQADRMFSTGSTLDADTFTISAKNRDVVEYFGNINSTTKVVNYSAIVTVSAGTGSAGSFDAATAASTSLSADMRRLDVSFVDKPLQLGDTFEIKVGSSLDQDDATAQFRYILKVVDGAYATGDLLVGDSAYSNINNVYVIAVAASQVTNANVTGKDIATELQTALITGSANVAATGEGMGGAGADFVTSNDYLAAPEATAGTDFGVYVDAISGKLSIISDDNTADELYYFNSSLTDYQTLLGKLDSATNTVNNAAASFGTLGTRIDIQKDFLDKLVDTLTTGLGALVDADMSEEAARLQALQVQEQLGTQALSIANQAPQSILALFR